MVEQDTIQHELGVGICILMGSALIHEARRNIMHCAAHHCNFVIQDLAHAFRMKREKLRVKDHVACMFEL
jgi:hypothetical protein